MTLVRERSPLSHVGLRIDWLEGVINLIKNSCSAKHKLFIDQCLFMEKKLESRVEQDEGYVLWLNFTFETIILAFRV